MARHPEHSEDELKERAERARERARRGHGGAGNENSKSKVVPQNKNVKHHPDDPAKLVCGARTGADKVCAHPPGWGTDHPGAGPCKLHGGMSPVGIKAAARTQLALLAGRNLPDVRPMEAILMCVRIAAAEVQFFSQKIDELDPEGVLERPDEQMVAGKDPEVFWIKKQKELSIWIRSREKAMDRLVRYSKQALDAGIEERQVRLAERMGDLIADTLQGVIDELELTPEQEERFPAIAQRRLRQIAAVAS